MNLEFKVQIIRIYTNLKSQILESNAGKSRTVRKNIISVWILCASIP